MVAVAVFPMQIWASTRLGAVYEALLSYRGFIAEHDLYEVKRAGDSFNELDVGYFVSESELDQYHEDERVVMI